METERTASGGSWWLGGGEERLETALEEMVQNEQHVTGGVPVFFGRGEQAEQPLQPAESSGMVDSSVQMLHGCSSTCTSTHRLRWTPQLHEQFVDAVNLLGGANKSTPRAIINAMGVHGLGIRHIKSHLEKYRQGKTGTRLWRQPFVPLPSSYYSGYRREVSSSSNAFDKNHNRYLNEHGIEPMETNTNGNLHPQVEPQATCENLEVEKADATAATANEGLVSTESAALELYPSIQSGGIDGQSHHYLDFFDFPAGGKHEPVVPQPVDNSSVDGLTNDPGFLYIPDCAELGLSGAGFGSFFDDVASFSNLDDKWPSPL